MQKPDIKLIKKETKALKKLKPKIRPRSVFGTDNIAQIAAQIAVLENNLDDDEICDRYDHSGLDEEILEAALNARKWLDGDDETETLSEDWKCLIVK